MPKKIKIKIKNTITKEKEGRRRRGKMVEKRKGKKWHKQVGDGKKKRKEEG